MNLINKISLAVFGFLMLFIPTSVMADGCTVGCGVSSVSVGSNLVNSGTSRAVNISVNPNPVFSGTVTAAGVKIPSLNTTPCVQVDGNGNFINAACPVASVTAASSNIAIGGTLINPTVDLSQTPHISSATVDNLIQLGTVGGNRNQAYGLGSSGSGGHTYFLACASAGADGSICQADGIYGDILAITDSSSVPYFTINSNHDIGINGNIHAPGAQFTNLTPSSNICTDSSSNLTTNGCTSGGGTGVATVSAGPSGNVVISGDGTNPIIDLANSQSITGSYTADSFISTGTSGATQGLDGPIIHSTAGINIPNNGSSRTFAITTPPPGVQQILNDIGQSGNPIYAFLATNNNQGCGCSSYGKITAYDGTNITFQSINTNNGGRGTNIVYIQLLGPYDLSAVGGTPTVLAAQTFTSTTNSASTNSGIDGPILHPTSSISIPNVGNTATWTIYNPSYGIQEYLKTVGDSNGGPIYAHLTSSGNEGCNCAAYGEITSYNGSNQITFKTIATSNGGRGANVYIHLLGPVSINSANINQISAGPSGNIVIAGTQSAQTVDLSANPAVTTLLVGSIGNFFENSGVSVNGVNCGNWGVSQFGQTLLCMDGNGNFGVTGNSYATNLYTGTNGSTGSVTSSTINAQSNVIIGTAGNNGTLSFYPNGYIGFNSQADTHGNVYWNVCYNSSSSCESVSGVRGDLFDINDGSAYYATIDINGNLGLAGAVKATGANFSGLSASSTVCTDASKNLTTSGCSSGGSSSATYRFPLVSGSPGQDFSATTSNVGNNNSISAYELSGQSIKKFNVACYPNISGDANNPYTPSTAITGGILTLYDAGSAITTIGTLTLPDSPSGGPFVNGATTTFVTPFSPELMILFIST